METPVTAVHVFYDPQISPIQYRSLRQRHLFKDDEGSAVFGSAQTIPRRFAFIFSPGRDYAAEMRSSLLPLVSLLIIAGFSASPSLASPEQEKEFTDKYKTAFEANDSATLESFLYTQGADPTVLEFYKMMITQGAGSKISKIELVELSAEDAKKAEKIQEGPGGTKLRLPLKPTKKLKITLEASDANGNSSTTSESFIAEKDGKLVIPVPVPVK